MQEGFFYQTTKDEEDHKQAAQGGFSIYVSIANSGHGHHEQVDTFPVGEGLGILKVFPRVPRVLHLESRSKFVQQEQHKGRDVFCFLQTDDGNSGTGPSGFL